MKRGRGKRNAVVTLESQKKIIRKSDNTSPMGQEVGQNIRTVKRIMDPKTFLTLSV